jgi:hypothetical protein
MTDLGAVTQDTVRERDEDAAKAVALLRQAIERDPMRTPDTVAELLNQPQLRPLRGHSGFEKLRQEMGVEEP